MNDSGEQELLRSVALQNAQTILAARHRAEQALLEAKHELEESRQLLQAALLAAGAGAFKWELDAETFRLGENLRVLLRQPALPPSLTLNDLAMLVNEQDRLRFVSNFRRAARDGTELDVEFRLGDSDPSPFWIEVRGRLLIEEGGAASAFVGTFTDITTRKANEQALLASTTERERLLLAERAARAQAERAGLMKDEFLSTLSHELRTPLNAVLGWAQILLSRPGDPDTLRRGAEVIARNAKLQAKLIDDLLDMNRIVSGKVRLDTQPTWLDGVVEGAIEAIRPTAEAKGVAVRKQVEPSAGPISGDSTRLQQVIWNLLTNAIKFTPRGGTVSVRVARINSHVELSIADDGIGIAPEFLPFVFERFRQADSSTTRSVGGLGLGLAIVKQLVELHGGQVTASSDGEGRGTTVLIKLPIAPVLGTMREALEAGANTAKPEAFVVDLGKVRVLVVDDEPDAGEMLGVVLGQSGASVTVVNSAAEALQRLESEQFDILISDIGMPGQDGYQLMRELRRRPAEQGGILPAVALTAFARPEDRTRAMLSGYQVHLSKPVEPWELTATVGSLLGRYSER